MKIRKSEDKCEVGYSLVGFANANPMQTAVAKKRRATLDVMLLLRSAVNCLSPAGFFREQV